MLQYRGDLDVVREIRQAAGGEVSVMVDYNQSLTVPEGVNRGRVLDDEAGLGIGLEWDEAAVSRFLVA